MMRFHKHNYTCDFCSCSTGHQAFSHQQIPNVELVHSSHLCKFNRKSQQCNLMLQCEDRNSHKKYGWLLFLQSLKHIGSVNIFSHSSVNRLNHPTTSHVTMCGRVSVPRSVPFHAMVFNQIDTLLCCNIILHTMYLKTRHENSQMQLLFLSLGKTLKTMPLANKRPWISCWTECPPEGNLTERQRPP